MDYLLTKAEANEVKGGSWMSNFFSSWFSYFPPGNNGNGNAYGANGSAPGGGGGGGCPPPEPG